MAGFKQLLQDEADNKAAQATVKAALGKLLDVAAKDRTDAQKAEMVTKKAELTALEADAVSIAEDLALARKLQDDIKATGGRGVQMGADHNAERPWGPNLHADATPEMREEAQQAALGEFAIAVYNASMGRGSDPRLFAAATGMGSAVPSDGGFAVPHEIAAGIERDMFAGGDVLSRVDARTISGDSIAYTVIDETSRASTRSGGVVGYWVDQGTAATASQPKLARVELKLRKVAALGYMTDELVADAAGLGGELQSMFGDELVFQVEDAITEGNGAGQPLGYLSAPCLISVAKESGQSAATIVNDNILKMWMRMPARGKKNAVWLKNGDCDAQLDVLSQAIGTGGIPSRVVTYDASGIMSIKGRPVIETEYNATLGTVGDLVLIDLSQYRLIRKGGVEQASSIHVRFTQGEQTFRAFYRCDGQMMPRSALTPFKGTTTRSPVVVLATRS